MSDKETILIRLRAYLGARVRLASIPFESVDAPLRLLTPFTGVYDDEACLLTVTGYIKLHPGSFRRRGTRGIPGSPHGALGEIRERSHVLPPYLHHHPLP